MTSLGSQVTVWGCLLTSANSSALVAATSDLGSSAGCCAVTMIVGYRQVCDCGRPAAR